MLVLVEVLEVVELVVEVELVEEEEDVELVVVELVGDAAEKLAVQSIDC